MLKTTLSTAALTAILALGLTACNKGSAEGSYTIDKAAMKKEAEAKINKLPEDQRAMAKLGLAMIDKLEMTLELNKGGEAEFSTKMMGKSDTKKGKWTEQDGSITISAGEAGKELSCKLDGSKLECKKADDTLVFVKK
jgi:hypothetical protein